MRRLLLILFFLPLLLSGQTLIDSYAETNQDAVQGAYSGSYYQYGQSFTNTTAINLHSCKFYMKKTGSPTGNVYAYVFAHSGTYGSSSIPTGSALATSDALDISTLTISYAVKTLTFSGANIITLSASTKYVLVIEYNAGNSTNRLDIGYDNSSPTHSGNNSRYNGTWQALSRDIPFYVYGTPLSTASPFMQIMY